MSIVVYALLETADAEAAEREIRSARAVPPGNVIQLHRTAPVDANILPDVATEYGRNMIFAIGLGAVFMATAGGIAGAMDLMLGVGVGMGVGLGFVTGMLMGFVGAMQAGTRVAKPSLRDLEARLRDGKILLVVDADGRPEATRVAEIVERHRPLELDTIGGW